MPGVAHHARLSSRLLSSRFVSHNVIRRGFVNSARGCAAQNYAMPALSPTMTEGNIANWRVKEGDSFSAGDVLLEIETDKATMDVEAQDDGILMKIMKPDGSKGVKVGQRIALTAEPGDDINSLEVPAEEPSADIKAETAKNDSSSKRDKDSSPAEKKDGGLSKQGTSEKQPSKAPGNNDAPRKQRYPLYPSVEHILHQSGLAKEEADKIPATGPNGRLLKGDVLAYLGKISKDYPAKSATRLEKLGHLDLSNIQVAPKKEQPAKDTRAKAPEPETAAETEVAVPISLESVIATQKRVQDTLGIYLPLSTFIARASELANNGLPVSKTHKPTADDLFNSVLGLDQVAKGSRGAFYPSITGLMPASPPAAARTVKKPDIIDILASKQTHPKARPQILGGLTSISPGDNIFAVTAPSGEEARAREYLERMKLVLEKEPGRLVL